MHLLSWFETTGPQCRTFSIIKIFIERKSIHGTIFFYNSYNVLSVVLLASWRLSALWAVYWSVSQISYYGIHFGSCDRRKQADIFHRADSGFGAGKSWKLPETPPTLGRWGGDLNPFLYKLSGELKGDGSFSYWWSTNRQSDLNFVHLTVVQKNIYNIQCIQYRIDLLFPCCLVSCIYSI